MDNSSRSRPAARAHRQGFTLIEMLVVVAIVGILSAVVLTALGPSRAKARDVRIISDVGQARALAELQYNNLNFAGLPSNGMVSGSCANPSDEFIRLSCDIANQGGGGLNIRSTETSLTAKAYVFWASLNAGAGVYCADSEGHAKTLPSGTVPGGLVCP